MLKQVQHDSCGEHSGFAASINSSSPLVGEDWGEGEPCRVGRTHQPVIARRYSPTKQSRTC